MVCVLKLVKNKTKYILFKISQTWIRVMDLVSNLLVKENCIDIDHFIYYLYSIFMWTR